MCYDAERVIGETRWFGGSRIGPGSRLCVWFRTSASAPSATPRWRGCGRSTSAPGSPRPPTLFMPPYFSLLSRYAMGEVARAETAAECEHERSERLLTNILPSPIAARLKSESHVVIADRHDESSILFADMAGFTCAGER